MPLCPCSLLHTHTHTLLHHGRPPPIRLSLSAAPCCRCFQRSELFVCSEARRLIAVSDYGRPSRPILTSALSADSPATPTLSFKRNTSPGNYGDTLADTASLSVMMETSGQTGWQSQGPTRFKCISWPLIIHTKVSPCFWSSLVRLWDSLSEWTHKYIC